MRAYFAGRAAAREKFASSALGALGGLTAGTGLAVASAPFVGPSAMALPVIGTGVGGYLGNRLSDSEESAPVGASVGSVAGLIGGAAGGSALADALYQATIKRQPYETVRGMNGNAGKLIRIRRGDNIAGELLRTVIGGGLGGLGGLTLGGYLGRKAEGGVRSKLTGTPELDEG